MSRKVKKCNLIWGRVIKTLEFKEMYGPRGIRDCSKVTHLFTGRRQERTQCHSRIRRRRLWPQLPGVPSVLRHDGDCPGGFPLISWAQGAESFLHLVVEEVRKIQSMRCIWLCCCSVLSSVVEIEGPRGRVLWYNKKYMFCQFLAQSS